MIVRKFEPADFAQISAWGKEYGSDYSPAQFPGTGFIVDDVAAYFLYGTDSTCCWLENMIAKKGVDHHVREQALELIIDALLREAKQKGYHVAYAATDRFTVALRAKKYGAKVQPNHLMLTLNLNEI